jgi:hypothetical protein
MACQGENLVVLNLKLLFAMFSESSGRIATAKKWALWLGGKRNYSLGGARCKYKRCKTHTHTHTHRRTHTHTHTTHKTHTPDKHRRNKHSGTLHPRHTSSLLEEGQVRLGLLPRHSHTKHHTRHKTNEHTRETEKLFTQPRGPVPRVRLSGWLAGWLAGWLFSSVTIK